MKRVHPNLLIQDPLRNCSYLIPSEELQIRTTTAKTLQDVSNSTITFVIPDENFIEEIPFSQSTSIESPKILIQNPRIEESYLFEFDELVKFKTENKMNYGEGYDISFIIPNGSDELSEIPVLMRDLLQSGTRVG